MRLILGVFIVALYSGLTYYIGWGLRHFLQAWGIYRYPILFWSLLFVVAFSFVIARVVSQLSVLAIVGNYWMFVVQYGLILMIISQLIIWLTPLTIKQVSTAAMALFVLLFALGTYYAYKPVVRELTVEIDKAGEDLRVVLGTDFHLGALANKGLLENFVSLSNEANPDLVLLAGDIVDDDPKIYIENNMAAVMRELKSTYGVYGVLGNHEYYGNKIPQFIEAMENSNVRILQDETIILENRLALTGQEDRTNKKRIPLQQLQPEDSAMPWFVMNHTPDELATPASLGADFHVSGHTHRGQLWPNHLFTERLFDLDYGHKQIQNMHAVVSSGFGFWGPPMRIGTQSELWIIDIQFTK